MSKCIIKECRYEGWASEPVRGETYCHNHVDIVKEKYPGRPFNRLRNTWPYTGSWRGHRETKIYFLHCPGYIKIGSSMDPRSRLKVIRTGVDQSVTPVGVDREALDCIGWIYGNRAREFELHSRYSNLQVAGEWFAATPELEAEIAELLQELSVAA